MKGVVKTIKPEHIKQELGDNHKRSLTSALVIIEQMLAEVRDLMISPPGRCCYEVIPDLDINKIDKNLKTVEDALKQICSIKEKYGVVKAHQSLQRSLNAKKAKIWEVLCDSKSKKLKGFGSLPSSIAKEYDNDIDKLISITSTIET
jgi:hypothetical protein